MGHSKYIGTILLGTNQPQSKLGNWIKRRGTIYAITKIEQNGLAFGVRVADLESLRCSHGQSVCHQHRLRISD